MRREMGGLEKGITGKRRCWSATPRGCGFSKAAVVLRQAAKGCGHNRPVSGLPPGRDAYVQHACSIPGPEGPGAQGFPHHGSSVLPHTRSIHDIAFPEPPQQPVERSQHKSQGKRLPSWAKALYNCTFCFLSLKCCLKLNSPFSAFVSSR